jgi:hypothetical protein
MAIKSVLTYEISEAAVALGVSVATIRNWIKDGLPVMATKKPFLISGAELRAYLQSKNDSAKKPLNENELNCFHCRAGRKPIGLAVVCHPNTPKTSRLAGECERCGGAASRLISNSRREEFAATFNFKTGTSSETY